MTCGYEIDYGQENNGWYYEKYFFHTTYFSSQVFILYSYNIDTNI